jgi:hypothetical protein
MMVTSIEEKMAAIELNLREQYGPIVGGSALWKLLGFRTSAAFRQALSRGKLPIAVFPIPNRKGKFALVNDVAQWLVALSGEHKKD